MTYQVLCIYCSGILRSLKELRNNWQKRSTSKLSMPPIHDNPLWQSKVSGLYLAAQWICEFPWCHHFGSGWILGAQYMWTCQWEFVHYSVIVGIAPDWYAHTHLKELSSSMLRTLLDDMNWGISLDNSRKTLEISMWILYPCFTELCMLVFKRRVISTR